MDDNIPILQSHHSSEVINSARNDEANNDITNGKEISTEKTKLINAYKVKIWKNIIALSFTFMMNYTAYYGLFVLQSSLHLQEGLGTTCTSIRYVVFTFSSLFFTSVLIAFCGYKWTMTISLVSFIIWVVANGLGTWNYMVPASILNGLFDAPLWIAQASYISEQAKYYAKITNNKADKVSTMFFSVFAAIHSFATVFGNGISWLILKDSNALNYTEPSHSYISENCGFYDCPWIIKNNTNFDKPHKNTVWYLVFIYLAFSLCAFVMSIIFVGNIEYTDSKESNENKSSNSMEDNAQCDNFNNPTNCINTQSETSQESTEQQNTANTTNPAKEKQSVSEVIQKSLLSSLRLFKNYRLWLLIPINLYPGFFSSLKNADFNRSWITCVLGISMVGLVGIPCDTVTAILSIVTGCFSKLKGRIFIMTISFGTGLALMFILTFWKINKEDVWIYFAISAGFGVHQGLFDPIVCSIQGITFPDDTVAVYSCHTFFCCLATIATYGYSHYLCSDIKIYIVIGSMIAGFASYYAVDSLNCRSRSAN